MVGLGAELVHLFGFQGGWVSWFVTHDFLRLFWAHVFFDLCLVFNHEMPEISLCLKRVVLVPWV